MYYLISIWIESKIKNNKKNVCPLNKWNTWESISELHHCEKIRPIWLVFASEAKIYFEWVPLTNIAFNIIFPHSLTLCSIIECALLGKTVKYL